MKTIFRNKNLKPCLVLFFKYENNKKELNFIYSFIVSLYNCITLIVQEKCTKCTRLPFVKVYNWLWVIPLFFLSLMDCTHMSCTLFNSHMEIPILSTIMIYGEKNFDLKSSTIFSTKPLEIWLSAPTLTHNLGCIWNLCHCTRVLH